MSKALINFWLDFLMMIVFSGLVWAATIVRYVFPPPTSATEWTLWGGSLDTWMGVEFGLLALFTFLVVVHLCLHWNWVCGIFASHYLPKKNGQKATIDYGMRTIYGVGLMIVMLNILGLAIAAAVLTIQGPV